MKSNVKCQMSTVKRGFSMVEVLVSTFIFVLIMIAVTEAFVSLFGGYKNSKIILKNLENAQFSMNLMAKSLRTSSVVSPTTNGESASVKFYNHSTKECVYYIFLPASKTLQFASEADPQPDGSDRKTWCQNESLAALGSFKYLVKENITGSFDVIPSVSGTVGRVTISASVSSGSDAAKIQSTVSLRDYEETMP